MAVYEYEKKGELSPFTQVTLLSGSPRRRELAHFLNPIVDTFPVEERSIEEHFASLYASLPFLEKSAKICCGIAAGKAGLRMDEKGLCPDPDFTALPHVLYLAADTMVLCNEERYNKPVDEADAERMLRSYFGNTHRVVTSVCLRMEENYEIFYSTAEVTFTSYYPELEGAIRDYLHSSSPMDKAGAYGIQELDPRFISSIRGDIYTIIGLPVSELARRIAPLEKALHPPDFPSLDEFSQMVERILEDMPSAVFEGLNGLVQIQPQIEYHPAAKNQDLIVMGRYVKNALGRHIEIYYGSFHKQFRFLTKEALQEKMRETIYHEFRHHMENMAGNRDLEIEDEEWIAQFRGKENAAE